MLILYPNNVYNILYPYNTNFCTQHCKFSIKDLCIECDLLLNFLRIWSYLLKNFLMESLIFCAVQFVNENKQYICKNILTYWSYMRFFILQNASRISKNFQ